MRESQGMALPPVSLTPQVRVSYTTENTLSDAVSEEMLPKLSSVSSKIVPV